MTLLSDPERVRNEKRLYTAKVREIIEQVVAYRETAAVNEDQAYILDRVLMRLREQIDQANSSNC